MTDHTAPGTKLRTDFIENITVTLNRAEAKSIARMIRWRIRRTERDLSKSTFVPEPGHRNAAEVSIERMFALLGKFEDALDMDIQVWEDEEYIDE